MPGRPADWSDEEWLAFARPRMEHLPPGSVLQVLLPDARGIHVFRVDAARAVVALAGDEALDAVLGAIAESRGSGG